MDRIQRLEHRLARRAPSFTALMRLSAKAEDGDLVAAAKLARLRPPAPYAVALHQVAFGTTDCGPSCPCREDR